MHRFRIRAVDRSGAEAMPATLISCRSEAEVIERATELAKHDMIAAVWAGTRLVCVAHGFNGLSQDDAISLVDRVAATRS